MTHPTRKHGTESMYQTGRCRCAACREAHRRYRAERRLRLPVQYRRSA